MIGNLQINKKINEYRGKPCYEYVKAGANITVSGIGDDLPSCEDLRNADMFNAAISNRKIKNKFDLINWLKDNPLYAAGGAVLLFFLLKK